MTNAEDVLTHRGVLIPDGVGKAACSAPFNGPTVVAELHPTDGRSLGNERIEIGVLGYGRGDVVVRTYDSDGDVESYYAMEEGVVQSCVASLVNATDFVVTEGDEEYLPPSIHEDDESEFEFGTEVYEVGNEDPVETLSTSNTTSDRFKATD